MTDQEPPGPPPPPAGALPVSDIALPTPSAPARPKPPRKWLGRGGGWIIFGGFAVAWIYLELVCVLILHYRSHLPLDLLLGSFAIAALFIYSMCYRLTPADRISPQFLTLVFLLGGFAAWMGPTLLGPLWEVITSGIPNGVVSPGQSTQPTPLVYSLPWGTIEELSKILIVLFIARWVPVKNARTGLFIGAAVGFGFSAWDNLEYGLSSFLGGLSYLPYTPISTLYSHAVSDLSITTVLREILGPFGHPLWTALVAAALFAGYSTDGSVSLAGSSSPSSRSPLSTLPGTSYPRCSTSSSTIRGWTWFLPISPTSYSASEALCCGTGFENARIVRLCAQMSLVTPR